MKKIHIFGGGTYAHVRPHLSLCAPAYGTVARRLAALFAERAPNMEVVLHLTKMADPSSTMITNADVAARVAEVVADLDTQIVVMSAALCDFDGSIVTPTMAPTSLVSSTLSYVATQYTDGRLDSSARHNMRLTPADKVIRTIRAKRKDIFLIGFKTTYQQTSDEQFFSGLNMMKKASCNLVLANDTATRHNMIITPEEARYHESSDREDVLRNLVDMAVLRSHLTFTRSTVVAAEPVSWASLEVPETLRTVVDYCVQRGAYKTGPTGATVGHFACKIGPRTFLTSRRKENFNFLYELGLVKVEVDGDDTVIAYGSKPSVGGQSQRILFSDHDEMDCVVHFHCPLRPDHADDIPVVSQREYECGSHQCGQNTSNGMASFGNLKAVMLDKHGPNIIFHHSTSPNEVIAFIERNFDLAKKAT